MSGFNLTYVSGEANYGFYAPVWVACTWESDIEKPAALLFPYFIKGFFDYILEIRAGTFIHIFGIDNSDIYHKIISIGCTVNVGNEFYFVLIDNFLNGLLIFGSGIIIGVLFGCIPDVNDVCLGQLAQYYGNWRGLFIFTNIPWFSVPGWPCSMGCRDQDWDFTRDYIEIIIAQLLIVYLFRFELFNFFQYLFHIAKSL